MKNNKRTKERINKKKVTESVEKKKVPIIKKRTCSACPDLKFATEVDYLCHLSQMHDGKMIPCCMCSECGKMFRTKCELTLHTRSECGTKKLFNCTVCNLKLMSGGSLYNHMLRHKNDRCYMCRFCANQFVTAGQLKAHERIHTKEKVYVCEVCGKGFAHRQSIITHSSTHTGIKPYVCENCDSSFSCIGNLLKHRKTHAKTCGLVPLVTHSVKHPMTKIKLKINTPFTSRQKNYSEYKLNALNVTIGEGQFVDEKKETIELHDQKKIDDNEENEDDNLDELFNDEIKSETCEPNRDIKKNCENAIVNLDCNDLDIANVKNDIIDEFIIPSELDLQVKDPSNKLLTNTELEEISKKLSSTKNIFKNEIKPDDKFDNTFSDNETVDDYNHNISDSDESDCETLANCLKKLKTQFEVIKCEPVDSILTNALETKETVEPKDTIKVVSSDSSDDDSVTLDVRLKTYKYVIKGHTTGNKVKKNKSNLGLKYKRRNMVKCEICHKLYKGIKWLRRHKKIHEHVHVEEKECENCPLAKKFKCSCCAVRFVTNEECKDHQRNFHSDILTCPICRKYFTKPISLKLHTDNFHTSTPDNNSSTENNAWTSRTMKPYSITGKRIYTYVCDKCGRQYRHKSSLAEHERTNCAEGPLFPCTLCPKRMHSIYALKAHMTVHKSEKKQLCTYCGKRFHWKGQLQIHLRGHTGEKPFKCGECGKTFPYRESLVTHESVHTGVKTHLCKACGSRFSCVGNLIKHKGTHASTCGEWYRANAALTAEQESMKVVDSYLA